MKNKTGVIINLLFYVVFFLIMASFVYYIKNKDCLFDDDPETLTSWIRGCGYIAKDGVFRETEKEINKINGIFK